MNVNRKTPYLNNRDLIDEIHKSKRTYSCYLSDDYVNYDFISTSIELITPEKLEEQRIHKFNIEYNKIKKSMIASGIKIPVVPLKLEDIPSDTIVVRIMTWDHIPLQTDPEKLRKAKTESDKHVKVNFPPFQHYIYKDNQWLCVAKSHWVNGIQNGHFSATHGRMTNKLAMMFMKLVEKYGHRGNWRSYCVDIDTLALTNRGWLNINEITEEDNIMSYSDNKMKLSEIKSIYKGEYDNLMHYITGDGIDALVTPRHKFVTTRGLIKIEELKDSDYLILSDTKKISVEDLDFHGGKTDEIITPTTYYKGMVWCPKTEYGCFLAKRNDKIYLTGNTYIDEMKSQALVQLSQIGLQFDESRSDTPNPFAYYTAVCNNSFTRILNLEKKSQNIRDDLLIMHGSTPSMTRQNDDAIIQQQNFANDEVAKKKLDK